MQQVCTPITRVRHGQGGVLDCGAALRGCTAARAQQLALRNRGAAVHGVWPYLRVQVANVDGGILVPVVGVLPDQVGPRAGGDPPARYRAPGGHGPGGALMGALQLAEAAYDTQVCDLGGRRGG